MSPFHTIIFPVDSFFICSSPPTAAIWYSPHCVAVPSPSLQFMVNPRPLRLHGGLLSALFRRRVTLLRGGRTHAGPLAMYLSPQENWSWLCLGISSVSPMISTYQVAVHPVWRRGSSAEFSPLFCNSLTAGKAAAAAATRRRITAAADWQVPSPGSAWGDAARPENHVGPSFSSGRYEATSLRKTFTGFCCCFFFFTLFVGNGQPGSIFVQKPASSTGLCSLNQKPRFRSFVKKKSRRTHQNQIWMQNKLVKRLKSCLKVKVGVCCQSKRLYKQDQQLLCESGEETSSLFRYRERDSFGLPSSVVGMKKLRFF